MHPRVDTPRHFQLRVKWIQLVQPHLCAASTHVDTSSTSETICCSPPAVLAMVRRAVDEEEEEEARA
jgi:hypothetical protein